MQQFLHATRQISHVKFKYVHYRQWSSCVNIGLLCLMPVQIFCEPLDLISHVSSEAKYSILELCMGKPNFDLHLWDYHHKFPVFKKI